MFSEYLARQLSHRGKVHEIIGVSKSTYYRHLKDPNEITLGEFRKMIVVGELDQDKVIEWLYQKRR